MEGSLREPLHAAEMKPGAGCGKEGGAVYAMFDGGMLPYDEGHCEVKAGRAFLESQVVPQGAAIEGATNRNRVLNSEYLMREGHYASFTAGAQWMQDWVAEKYPGAIHVLDFWHA